MNMEDRANPAVRYEAVGDHISIVTIDRPKARNAINAEITLMLEALIEQTELDPDIWVVILASSTDTVFCAGADLKEIAAGRGTTLTTRKGGFAGFVNAPRRKPWIAMVQGVAAGGGCEIALACDMIVAAETASFSLPEVQRAIAAAAGGMHRLPRALPRNIALELIATGERIDASRAAAFGMVNRLVPAAMLRDAAISLASRITRNAPLAVQESLAVARRAYDLQDDELLSLGRAAFAQLAETEDFLEGPRAFIEKRPPRWMGR
jgi:enoyl-CoA hydratase/carnithine racemase